MFSGDADGTRLTWYLVLVFVVMCVEAGVGWSSGSLALVADAGHLFFDAGAVVVGLLARSLASRRATLAFPQGFALADALAGFANGVILAAVGWSIGVEAALRLFRGSVAFGEEEGGVVGSVVVWTSVVGFGVNALGLLLFHRSLHASKRAPVSMQRSPLFVRDPCCVEEGVGGSVAVRSVALHLLGDALGSLLVLFAVVARWKFGLVWVEAVASLLLSLLLFLGAIPLLLETATFLIAPAPTNASKASTLASLNALRWWPGPKSKGWIALARATAQHPQEPLAGVRRAIATLLRNAGARQSTIEVIPQE